MQAARFAVSATIPLREPYHLLHRFGRQGMLFDGPKHGFVHHLDSDA